MTGLDKLTSLRSLFKSSRVLSLTAGKPINAYVLPSTDAHNVILFLVFLCVNFQSEYLTDTDFRVRYLSGFSGSNAYVVVTNNDALLWTDGRYFVQVKFII